MSVYIVADIAVTVLSRPLLTHAAPGGVLPSKRLLGMCRWMGSHFHDWTDYNGVTFLVVTRMGSQIFGIYGMKKILVSRDLKIGRLAVEKWLVLLF